MDSPRWAIQGDCALLLATPPASLHQFQTPLQLSPPPKNPRSFQSENIHCSAPSNLALCFSIVVFGVPEFTFRSSTWVPSFRVMKRAHRRRDNTVRHRAKTLVPCFEVVRLQLLFLHLLLSCAVLHLPCGGMTFLCDRVHA